MKKKMSLSEKRLKGSPHYYEDDVKEKIQNTKKRLKEISKENDWEVAVNDGYKEGFRVISGEECLDKIFLEEFGEELI